MTKQLKNEITVVNICTARSDSIICIWTISCINMFRIVAQIDVDRCPYTALNYWTLCWKQTVSSANWKIAFMHQ